MTLMSRLRRLWLDVHLWIGAGLLVVLVPLSVTGSILVWHDAIDRALYSQRYATSGALASRPVGAYADAATQAFEARARLYQLRLPQRAGDPVVAVGRLAGPPGPGGRPRTLNAWIDPPTARVLDVAEVAAQPTMLIHRLHGSLLVPGLGRKIVGWLGWAMFVSSATGLWLWWPRHGGLLRGLRWRRGASTLFNLHHLAGFWTCLPLAVLSLTGVYIAFPQTSHALVGAPPPPARPAGGLAAPVARPRMTPD
ncbi:MAG TPA: PepSY-associated TM helix domain-containing protein, partial [Phenylobacterium sp.]|nr:PepSY-associated TM helix domain-containing protein [Phenylobacterium sp.]